MVQASYRRVRTEDIARDRSSYVDPHGFLFHYQDRIYRLIGGSSRELFSRMIADGRLERLTDRHGLVRTTISDLQLQGRSDALVVEHEKVWPLTYCVEWCPSMLRDAACLTLSLCRELIEGGQTLQDAYPWNVLFSGSKPVFVDLTSIVPFEKNTLWPAHEQFDAFFTRPLVLADEGKGPAARSLLFDNIDGIALDEFYRLTSLNYRLAHPGVTVMRWLDHRLQKSAMLKERARQISESPHTRIDCKLRRRFYDRLLRRTEGFSFQKAADPWTSYYGEISEAFDKEAKLDAVRDLLARLKPATVLDLGCNTGVFSLEAVKTGAKVVSVDSSEACIERLYSTAKRDSLSLTPVVANVVTPTPPFGFMSNQYPPLWDRIRSEVVMCLGLMHHLHVSARQSFERIVEMLDAVADQHLIFEFVSMDDANLPHLSKRRPIEYDLHAVKTALSDKFPRLEVIPSDRPTRTLLLCSK